jgi:hypothetical protein
MSEEMLRMLGEGAAKIIDLVVKLVEIHGNDRAEQILHDLVENPAPKLDDDAFEKRLDDIEDADEG